MKSFIFETAGALGINYAADFGGRYSLVTAAIVLTEVSGFFQTVRRYILIHPALLFLQGL
jgi:hypothetical protein